MDLILVCKIVVAIVLCNVAIELYWYIISKKYSKGVSNIEKA